MTVACRLIMVLVYIQYEDFFSKRYLNLIEHQKIKKNRFKLTDKITILLTNKAMVFSDLKRLKNG